MSAMRFEDASPPRQPPPRAALRVVPATVLVPFWFSRRGYRFSREVKRAGAVRPPCSTLGARGPGIIRSVRSSRTVEEDQCSHDL